jgi:glycosyltransferase involved in cell wall biosynthesis
MFLINEFLKFFYFPNKPRIGFVFLGLPLPYNKVMPSTRLRVYDIITAFNNSKDYFLEIYKPYKKYDLVIFQKYFDKNAYATAKSLKETGTKIILDINVNYYDKSFLEKELLYQHKDVIKFTKLADGITTSTTYIRNYIKKIFPKKSVDFIPENITNNFFIETKKAKKGPLKLTYAGYSTKAKDLLRLKNILKNLRKKYDFSFLFICEKDPKIHISGIKSDFIKYNQKIIHKQLLKGDIFIAPRDLKNPYNLGHSFTKIGYPMAVGLPTIADEVPSYIGSPAILCNNKKDWTKALKKLLSNKNIRSKIGKKGIKYVKDNFSTVKVKRLYHQYFSKFI